MVERQMRPDLLADALDEGGRNEPRHLHVRAVIKRPAVKTVLPLFVLLCLWVWLFYAEGAFKGGPNGKSFEADFAMFFAAAQVMQAGGNPYNHQLLYHTEHALMQREHLPILTDSSVVRVGNPPFFFWALTPLLRLPFQTAGTVWLILLYGLCALSFLLLLRSMGWSARLVPLVIFLLTPQVLFGPFYGNVICLVFAGACLGLSVLERYPILAGALFSVAWLKPPVALPVVLILLVFHVSRRRHFLAGFAGATVLLAGISFLAVGGQGLMYWVHGLVGYSEDIGKLPDVASFAGLYVRSVPHSIRLSIEAMSVAIALIFTTLAWHRYARFGSVPLHTVGWLWALWFLATPYAHFFDEVLLVFPVLALLGPDGVYVANRRAIAALYLSFASLLVVSASPGGIQLLWLPLLAVMLCLYLDGRGSRAVLARAQIRSGARNAGRPAT